MRKRKPESEKCVQCGKVVYIYKEIDDKTKNSMGFYWIRIPTENCGCSRKIYTGKEIKFSSKIKKDYYEGFVCKDCMTIEDVNNSSLIESARNEKIRYINNR